MYKVDKVIRHPAHDRLITNNDIALLRLAQPIVYTDYIRPVCVAETSYDVTKAVECYISGWGYDSNALCTSY